MLACASQGPLHACENDPQQHYYLPFTYVFPRRYMYAGGHGICAQRTRCWRSVLSGLAWAPHCQSCANVMRSPRTRQHSPRPQRRLRLPADRARAARGAHIVRPHAHKMASASRSVGRDADGAHGLKEARRCAGSSIEKARRAPKTHPTLHQRSTPAGIAKSRSRSGPKSATARCRLTRA